MRGSSAIVSVSGHAVLVIGFLAAAASGRPLPQKPRIIELAPLPEDPGGPSPSWPAPPVVATGFLPPGIPDPNISLPSWSAAVGMDTGGRILARTPSSGWLIGGEPGPLAAHLADEYPVLLAGPVPAYPELLRVARAGGRVVLEAVIDSVGRVEPGSVRVVSGHPELGAAAARALESALFRPARVAGRAVRVRVRVPYEFSVR